MKRFRWWMLGGLLFAATVVVEFPASTAFAILATDHVRAGPVDVRGRWWRGRAYGVQWRGLDLGRLSWTLSPHGLLRGRVAMDVELAGAGHARMRFVRGLRRAELRDVRLTLPAGELGAAAAVLPQGRIRASIPRVALARGCPASFPGELAWAAAAPPGQAGALLSGSFTVDARRGRVRLWLRAGNAAGRQAMQGIGQPLADGRRALELAWPQPGLCGPVGR